MVTGTDAGAGLSGGAVGRVAAVAVVEFVGAWAVTAAEGFMSLTKRGYAKDKKGWCNRQKGV